jgi:hypothetical protein
METSVITPKRGRTAVLMAEADIERSPEEVFDYCSDPAHEPEWNIKMKAIERLTEGPVGVGTRYRMEFTSRPDGEYEQACAPREGSIPPPFRDAVTSAAGRMRDKGRAAQPAQRA